MPGTPRQNGAGDMLEHKYDLDFNKNVSILIGFKILVEGRRHEAMFQFQPHLREGLFRAID